MFNKNTSTTTSNGRTSSTTLAATASATKFKIEQKVPSGYNKKGPYAVERGIDPNKVIIKRRYGEGSKPLFEREDISINRIETDDHHQNDTYSCKTLHGRPRRHNSSDSSSPERYPRTGRNALTSPKHTNTSYQMSIKRRTPEKVPYFLDEKREKDRLIRTYGSTSATSHKRNQHESTTHKPTTTKRRQISGSPPRSSTNYTHAKSSTQNNFSSKGDVTTRRIKHYSTRNRSRDRDRRHSSSVERNLRHHSSRYHHSRSRSHSRTRSRSRDRNRGCSRDWYSRRERHEHTKSVPTPAAVPATQIITIPVPVDPYVYSAWPHQPAAWPTGAARYPAPYHLPHMMPPPPFASPVMLRPLRPPPYGMPPYNAPIFRPRFPPRQTRGYFRPRSYQ